MSKYEKFISDLKEEVNNMEVVDQKTQIKNRYLNQSKKPNLKIFKLLFTSMTFAIVLIVCILAISRNHTSPVIKPEKPVIASSIDESYAFELMAASNVLYSSDLDNLSTLSFMRLKTSNITLASENLHTHYLTMRQLLYNSKVDFEIKVSDKAGYDYKMIINPYLNEGLSLQYTLYFNKTLKEIDDDEEVYDITGIVILDSVEYQVIGTTEIEEDELETTIKVLLENNHYFVIEQEKEEDEYEYVYKEYLNNKLVTEYEISYEIEDNEIELVIEINSQETKGKIKAKKKNDKLTLKVEFDYYKGTVEVSEDKEVIEYYFKDENQTIKYEIFKKNTNFTNKNDILFVY